jgi:hypothetical protein
MGFAHRIEAVRDASAGTRVDPGGSQYRCISASGRRLLRAAEGPYTHAVAGVPHQSSATSTPST